MRRNKNQSPHSQRIQHLVPNQSTNKLSQINKIKSQLQHHQFLSKPTTNRKLAKQQHYSLQDNLAKVLRKQMKKQRQQQNKKKLQRLWNFRKAPKKQIYIPQITQTSGINSSQTNINQLQNNQQITQSNIQQSPHKNIQQNIQKNIPKIKNYYNLLNNANNNHKNNQNNNHTNNHNQNQNNNNNHNHHHSNNNDNDNDNNNDNDNDNDNNNENDNDNNNNHNSQNLQIQNNDSTLQKLNTSKIKEYITKLSQQSHQNSPNTTTAQLLQTVPFTSTQLQRLKLYFNHICQRMCNLPKTLTFDKAKSLLTTINQTEWMIFCKQIGITTKFKQFNQGLKLLSFIFRKNQNIQRRMNFPSFINALRQISYQLIKHTQSTTQTTSYSQQYKNILSLLCLDSKKNHLKKIQSIGVMCSLNSYSVPKSLLYAKNGIDKQNPAKQKKNTYIQQIPNKILQLSSTPNKFPTPTFPKIYKSSLQRRQSQLMHNLAITTINKLQSNYQTQNTLQQFIDDDLYLKLYFYKQFKNKSGNHSPRQCYGKKYYS